MFPCPAACAGARTKMAEGCCRRIEGKSKLLTQKKERAVDSEAREMIHSVTINGSSEKLVSGVVCVARTRVGDGSDGEDRWVQ